MQEDNCPFARIEFKDRDSLTRAPAVAPYGRGDPVPRLGCYVSHGIIFGKVTDVSYDYDESTIYVTLN